MENFSEFEHLNISASKTFHIKITSKIKVDY